MAGNSNFQSNNKVVNWIEERMPIFSLIDGSLGASYPAPNHLN